MIFASTKIPPITSSVKFLNCAGGRFFLKAVRLAEPDKSLRFEEKLELLRRLGNLRAGYTNALVIGDNEAEALLDLTAQQELYALLEIKVGPQELFSRSALRTVASHLRKRASNLRGYPSLIGYLLDCPVHPDILRSRGLAMVRARLANLVTALQDADADRIVGLKHRAATVGLILREEDFVYALMPPFAPAEFRGSAVRLHNLAETRPLILELGEARPGGGELISYAFAVGCAGVVAPIVPPSNLMSQPFTHDSISPTMLGRGESAPFLALDGACPPKPVPTPMVSVVICAYNAERTMHRCLESLRRLDYPNFEVIIVDDGSSDATAQIAENFPQFRLIRQPNKGLSVARNVGLHAALGELIAYTDSDCVADPHWLSFMVRTFVDQRLDGCGGPNYAPREPGWVQACVAASPGAPCHVLIGDDRAEHLAGCNMVFRKAALLEIGGFDPQFTAAGDDVDICWRLLDAGYTLGYCPAAFVWHFRRNTLQAYYRQQRGYGKAEAMLYFKYPERFNILGQIKWNGVIPGIAGTIPGGDRRRIGYVRSAEQLQRVDEAPLDVFSVAPMTAEWNIAAAALVVLSFLTGVTIVPGILVFAAGALWAAYYAWRASIDACHRGPASRIMIWWLAYTGPIMRAIARYRWRIHAQTNLKMDDAVRQRPAIDWKGRSIRLSYWNPVYTTREEMIEHLRRVFTSIGRPVIAATGWNDFDLQAEANPWTRIQFKTADEELGGSEVKTNVAVRLKLTAGARVMLGVCIAGAVTALAFATPLAATVLCIIASGATISALTGLAEGARLAYRAVEQCASELKLVPLGKAAKPASTQSVPAAEPERSAEAAQPAGR